MGMPLLSSAARGLQSPCCNTRGADSFLTRGFYIMFLCNDPFTSSNTTNSELLLAKCAMIAIHLLEIICSVKQGIELLLETC